MTDKSWIGACKVTQDGQKIEDIKLQVESGPDGHDVLALEESGPVTLASGLSRDYAERIAVAWNFCEGGSKHPLEIRQGICVQGLALDPYSLADFQGVFRPSIPEVVLRGDPDLSKSPLVCLVP